MQLLVERDSGERGTDQQMCAPKKLFEIRSHVGDYRRVKKLNNCPLTIFPLPSITMW
jgi:hypothetical protein